MARKLKKPSKISAAVREMLDGFERGGLVSKKELDRIFDARIEAIALERIKSAGESKFITHEELKARLSIDD